LVVCGANSLVAEGDINEGVDAIEDQICRYIIAFVTGSHKNTLVLQ
jgi:hypothetical protein